MDVSDPIIQKLNKIANLLKSADPKSLRFNEQKH